MTANLYLDVPECFVVFNDDPALPFDQVDASDLRPVRVKGEEARASAVWSSFCQWYFVIEAAGIYLLNIDGTGWFCRKRSAEFIRLFVEAPKARRR